MKLGPCHLRGNDLIAFRDEVRLAAGLDYDVIGVGDSPAGWHEPGHADPRATIRGLKAARDAM